MITTTTTSFDLITTLNEGNILTFLKESISHFFKEVNLYIDENDDPTLFGYCTERSLFSMYINGLYRNSTTITAIQEYKIDFPENKKGRADAFIKYNHSAIWIESKFEGIRTLEDNHWEIMPWLQWDRSFILTQLQKYYDSEKVHLENKTIYLEHYLITMVFKIIKEKAESHIEEANKKLLQSINIKEDDRDWYYFVGFFDQSKNNDISEGIEVYGSVAKRK